MKRDAIAEAARLLEDLAANGGLLRPQPDAGFLIEHLPGADRARCRRIASEIRASAGLVAAVKLLTVRQKARAHG